MRVCSHLLAADGRVCDARFYALPPPPDFGPALGRALRRYTALPASMEFGVQSGRQWTFSWQRLGPLSACWGLGHAGVPQLTGCLTAATTPSVEAALWEGAQAAVDQLARDGQVGSAFRLAPPEVGPAVVMLRLLPGGPVVLEPEAVEIVAQVFHWWCHDVQRSRVATLRAAYRKSWALLQGTGQPPPPPHQG